LTIVDSTESEGFGNISYSKATMLSARFPYISPAGKIGKHYFVDGGYFDNSGAGVVHEMLQSLVQEIKNDSVLSAKVRFEVIHITNTPDAAPLKELHPLTNDLAAPLVTVFNTYDAQTQVNDKRLNTFLIQLYGKGIEDINLYRTGEHESYPMNWVISEFQLNKMRERLEDIKAQHIQRLIRK
jgi:predicted acylesterase/phospholipase RssA